MDDPSNYPIQSTAARRLAHPANLLCDGPLADADEILYGSMVGGGTKGWPTEDNPMKSPGVSSVIIAPDLEPWETEADESHTDVEAALASRRTVTDAAMSIAALPETIRAIRHQSVIDAALKGGATDAEAKQLAHLDAITDVPAEQRQVFLREQFAIMVSARVCSSGLGKRYYGKPRHTVAKRYRARGRW